MREATLTTTRRCVYVILLIFVERKKMIVCGMTLDLSDGDGQENKIFFSFHFLTFLSL
jgi:hypothetical protein